MARIDRTTASSRPRTTGIHHRGYPLPDREGLPSPYRAPADRAVARGNRDDHDVASMAADPGRHDVRGGRIHAPAPPLPRPATTNVRRRRSRPLRTWDGDMRRVVPAPPPLYNAWCAAIARRRAGPTSWARTSFAAYHASRETFQCAVLPGLLGEPAGWLDDELLRAALDDAIAELTGATGRRSSAWLASFTAAHGPPARRDPRPRGRSSRPSEPFGGDEQTVAQGGFDGREGIAPP